VRPWHEFYRTINARSIQTSEQFPTVCSEVVCIAGENSLGKDIIEGNTVTTGLALNLTLGLPAWDKKYHTTAVKGYKEGIDLAATHPPFKALIPDSTGLP
jgi:hypothetical protein